MPRERNRRTRLKEKGRVCDIETDVCVTERVARYGQNADDLFVCSVPGEVQTVRLALQGNVV